MKQHSLGETVMLTDGGNPPDTAIIEGPSGTTDALTATASFSGTEGGRECLALSARWMTAAMRRAQPLQAFGVLSNGEHTLRVRAIDADGYVDPTPASVTWTVRMTSWR